LGFVASFLTFGVGVRCGGGGAEAGVSAADERLAARRCTEPNRSPQTGSSSPPGGNSGGGFLLMDRVLVCERDCRTVEGRNTSAGRIASLLTCSPTISRWIPANNRFASVRVKPRCARSPRSWGRLISVTSVACSTPQRQFSPTSRSRPRVYPRSCNRPENTPSALTSTNLRQSPPPDDGADCS
jgi:hypothetical protein